MRNLLQTIQQQQEAQKQLQERLEEIQQQLTNNVNVVQTEPPRSHDVVEEILPQGIKFQKPSTYGGSSTKLDGWIFEIEMYFFNIRMPSTRRVGYAASLLKDTATL